MSELSGTQACLRLCMRMCYDPHSQYLTDHYRLGQQLGKGNFGEVRAARLRLKAHTYSKRVVGKSEDALQRMKESQAGDGVDGSAAGSQKAGSKVAPDESMQESVMSTASAPDAGGSKR